jgi:spore coat polysaccharide biosynthesis protein SpsF
MSNQIRISNLAIIQARMGSSRLPKKVLLDLAGKSVLEQVVDRVKNSSLVDEIIVATTIEKQDLEIIKLCANQGIRVFCGSENDVLDRYYQAAKLFNPVNVIRITADCPLIDPAVIDQVIKAHLDGNYDYTSNVIRETFPDGEDVEIMKFSTLKEAWDEANLASQREHVTQYILNNDKYKKCNVVYNEDLSNKRWTLDNEEDYLLIREIYKKVYNSNKTFGIKDILNVLKNNPELENINISIARNEGLRKSLENDHKVVVI